jgi:hypothetical protein
VYKARQRASEALAAVPLLLLSDAAPGQEEGMGLRKRASPADDPVVGHLSLSVPISHLARGLRTSQDKKRRVSTTRPGYNLRLGGQGHFSRLSFEKTPIRSNAGAAERHRGSSNEGDASPPSYPFTAGRAYLKRSPWSTQMCGSAGERWLQSRVLAALWRDNLYESR